MGQRKENSQRGKSLKRILTNFVQKYSTVHYGQYRQTSGNVGQKYRCLSKWKAHQGKILASAVTNYRGRPFYITGSNDKTISLWSVRESIAAGADSGSDDDDVLISSLKEFVSYKTVSSRPEFAEDCRKGATFLGSLLKRLGGQVEMLSSTEAHNPVVCAKFLGRKESVEHRKQILFYGHYDVVATDNKNGRWATDPFTVQGMNGFLYGRGVSDNKGPVLAAVYAVSDLIRAQKLCNNVVFLIEGEEEFGSRGFEDVVRRNRNFIGPVDYILLANSYWLDDEVPCLTYGLRGALHTTICVDSPLPDIHSGVDGSYMMDEPLSDLTAVLAKLKGSRNRVQIPGFYDGISPFTIEEETRYDDIARTLVRRNRKGVSEESLKRSLMATWREPNLTIHRYKVSGPEGSLISGHASSHVSLRLVPGQEVDDVVEKLSAFLEKEFDSLESRNKLSVKIDNKSEPWLGNPSNKIFKTLEAAIGLAWSECFDNKESAGPLASGSAGTDDFSSTDNSFRPRGPLYIREGGSIPAIRFLEKEFEAPAAHLPCGQSSDSAHLDNERIRVTNLLKAREIFAQVFAQL